MRGFVKDREKSQVRDFPYNCLRERASVGLNKKAIGTKKKGKKQFVGGKKERRGGEKKTIYSFFFPWGEGLAG